MPNRFDVARGLTQEQAAHEWGVSKQYINQLLAAGTISRREDGSVDGPSLRAWGLRREAEKQIRSGDGENGEEQETLQYWKKREARANALRKEDEARKNAGELIEFAEVHQMQADMYARLRSHVKAMTAKIPTALGLPRVDHDKARKVLAGLERDLLLAVSSTEADDDDDNLEADDDQ